MKIKVTEIFIILLLSFVLIGCTEEKQELYAGTYEIEQLTYHTPVISYVPSINLVSISEKAYFKEDSGEKIEGYLIEFELTKENFDVGFSDIGDEFGWANHDNQVKSLRKNNNRAWYVDTDKELTCYVLLQDDGKLYLAWVYGRDDLAITNIYELKKVNSYF